MIYELNFKLGCKIWGSPVDQIPRSVMLLVGFLPTMAHHSARIAALTSRLRTPVLLHTVLINESMQRIKEMSKHSRLNTTKVGERPSVLTRNMANWRSVLNTRAKALNTMAQSPISSKPQGMMPCVPLGEPRPANVGEDLDGPGDDANGWVPKE
jgi:hypothetical protein